MTTARLTTSMPELTIQLNLSPGEVLRYYRGTARAVQALATNGQTVQFPAAALQRHVTSDGVRGLFRIVFSDDHKFVRLEPVRPN